MSYADDLLRVSEEYRLELQFWFETGRLPKNRTLREVLNGHLEHAVESGGGEIADILQFLRRHVPRWAWGSDQALANWEYMGGRDTAITGRKGAAR